MDVDKIAGDPVHWLIAFAFLGVIYGYAIVMSVWITNGLLHKWAEKRSLETNGVLIIVIKLFLLLPIVGGIAWTLPLLIRVHKIMNGDYFLSAVMFFVVLVITVIVLMRKAFEIKWR